MGEIVHAAARGEKICTFFINNCVYGMTSGRWRDDVIARKRRLSEGRTVEQAGMPIRMAELISRWTALFMWSALPSNSPAPHPAGQEGRPARV
jgi:hypothetical protein